MSADFITLACPSCAGQLRVTNDSERFACRHCGREHLVRRQGGQVSLHPVVKQLERMTRRMDRNASELAIKRLTPERKRLKWNLQRSEEEYWNAQSGLGFYRPIMYCCYGAATSLVPFSISAFFAGLSPVWPVMGFALSALLGFVGLGVRSIYPMRLEQVESARRRFDRARDELRDCEAELDYHHNVVSV